MIKMREETETQGAVKSLGQLAILVSTVFITNTLMYTQSDIPCIEVNRAGFMGRGHALAPSMISHLPLALYKIRNLSLLLILRTYYSTVLPPHFLNTVLHGLYLYCSFYRG